MLSLCPLMSRLSLATRTNAAKLLKGKTIPALVNSGVEANRVIGVRTFSVNSDLDGDDGGGDGGRKKESNAYAPLGLHNVCYQSDFDFSKEDFNVIVEWSYINKESNAFLGGRHGKMIEVEVNSRILEVPWGILPSSIEESDKEEMYRLHMEDPEVYTPERLAKDYNTAAETVDIILMLRDALKNRQPQFTERIEMYRLYMKNPKIYTIDRLAKDFKVARATAHIALFSIHQKVYLKMRKSPNSHGQEMPSLPFARWMKEHWDRFTSNRTAYNEELKLKMDYDKRYKELICPEGTDEEFYKLRFSRVSSVDEFNEMYGNSKRSQP